MSALLLAFSLINSIIFFSPWQYHRGLGMMLPRSTVVGREQKKITKWSFCPERGLLYTFSEEEWGKQKRKPLISYMPISKICSLIYEATCAGLFPFGNVIKHFNCIWCVEGFEQQLHPQDAVPVLQKDTCGLGHRLQPWSGNQLYDWAPQASTWSKKSALHWNKYKTYWSLLIPCVNPAQRNVYTHFSCLMLGKNKLEEGAHRTGLEMHSHPSAMLPGTAFVENSHGNSKVTTNISQSDLFSLPLGRKIFLCLP